MNIRISVIAPRNSNDYEQYKFEEEAQVYSNHTNIPLHTIQQALKGQIIDPIIGNFPHVAGRDAPSLEHEHGKGRPVRIFKVGLTNDEDNTGIDVSEILNKL
ncbi:hypothetical protein IC617_08565 [Neiella sp. HB171785]|uniref:Uncharacterized protein n=1 Tax=Neiella litorisoli TaxID=2771431 RepID=A0A8J6UIY8_9GAMM|nr:hypothetical protein [Neiella litorisoli]MBD1389478.1 hypothetical protein [Neiella litorisoli]